MSPLLGDVGAVEDAKLICDAAVVPAVKDNFPDTLAVPLTSKEKVLTLVVPISNFPAR